MAFEGLLRLTYSSIQQIYLEWPSQDHDVFQKYHHYFGHWIKQKRSHWDHLDREEMKYGPLTRYRPSQATSVIESAACLLCVVNRSTRPICHCLCPTLPCRLRFYYHDGKLLQRYIGFEEGSLQCNEVIHRARIEVHALVVGTLNNLREFVLGALSGTWA